MKIIEEGLFGDSNLALCEAEKSDAGVIWQAECACFESDPWSESAVRDAFDNESCKIHVLYNMQLSKIVAYSVIYHCLDEADLANIAVIPEERGKGLGGRFLDRILEKAREYGVLRVFLEVRESNAAARGLYTSRGFIEIGKRKRYYRRPVEDAVLMLREQE